MSTREHPFAVVEAFRDSLVWVVPMLLIAYGVAGIEILPWVFIRLVRGLVVAALIVVLARLVFRILEWDVSRVVITNEQLVHVRGVLVRRISSTPLVKVTEMSVVQTPVGRLFGFGSLVVDSPGGDRALHGLRYLPDPASIHRLIVDSARSRRASEGGGANREVVLPEEKEVSYEGGPVILIDDVEDSPVYTSSGTAVIPAVQNQTDS